MPEFWPLVGPSFVVRLPWDIVETIDGPALELLGPGGLEERFLTRISSAGKESWSAQEGETSGASSEGKDRDCERISRMVTWWRIMAGVEI